ncbi:TetR/AcrR family transcriptional regulator [Edaphosphingomonas haloaromaticamans]|uniref:Bacterial regulatory protein, tetR family n=1 Tax=Edaphosphingomonas haloaromaticamans TaxID=653954 RepID=A0A1S1HGC6_9SPHN|nr:TetR/AcrR family transcriptional regulator [Sphingomonas haloaromaticamans]OHT21147.1 Bacterial regulatory protein, tetR family [Sphingomonas haloaromaticamans]
MSQPSPVADPGRPRRGRPRNPETDAAILAAARHILATRGFDALSIEAVAQATGISRVSIYRRWASKAHLTSEIANGGEGRLPDVIAEQGVEAEIRALVRQLYDRYAEPAIGAAAIGMIVSYQREPSLREELHSPLESDARAQLRSIVARGKALDLVREEVDADALFDIAVGTTLFRLLVSTEAPGASTADAIADIVLKGVAKAPA